LGVQVGRKLDDTEVFADAPELAYVTTS